MGQHHSDANTDADSHTNTKPVAITIANCLIQHFARTHVRFSPAFTIGHGDAGRNSVSVTERITTR